MNRSRYSALTKQPILVLVILVSLFGVSATKADNCRVVPSPIGFGGLPEKDIIIYVRKDTPCTVTFGRVPFASFQQRVTKHPRGIYGVASTVYGAYRPPAG